MAKNPKIEIYKIHLNSLPDFDDITFRDVFKEIYLLLNENFEASRIDTVSDNDLKTSFFQYFFNQINAKFKSDNRRKKAFYAKSNVINGTTITPIKISTSNSTIDGLIKGGDYDTGKNLGNISRPQDETSELDRTNILLDDFYFSLYTPLNKDIGVLLLQSYTKDHIADIFLPFIWRLFKIPRLTYNSSTEKFMPKIMQEAFKQNSVIEKFKFSNRVLVSEMDQGVAFNEEFSINIEIKSLGRNINLRNLDQWKQKIGDTLFNVPSNPERELSSFNKQFAYLKSNNGKSRPTKFELNAGSIDLNATIFLQNHIRLEDNGIPDWNQLAEFASNTLNDIVKPEVYPEDYLNED